MRVVSLVPSLLVLFVVPFVACARPVAPPAPRLAVSSEREARAALERFFTDYVAGDVEATLAHLCEQDAPSRARYRAFLERSQAEGSPFRVTRFSVRAIEAGWHGKEPYFFGEVAFPRTRGPGEVAHPFRLRAREGCLEHFLGAPRPTAPHGPIDSAPKAPPGPPVPPVPAPAPEEIIEL